MANENVNKVVYGGNVLIDLTSDTVTPKTLAKGATAHDASGAMIEGEYMSELIITAIASANELTNISETFKNIYAAHQAGASISLHIQSPSGAITILQCTSVDSDYAIFDAVSTITGDSIIHSAIIFSDDTSMYNSSSVGGGTSDAVQYVEQELTDDQKSQARKNIAAAGIHYGSEEPPSDDYIWIDPDGMEIPDMLPYGGSKEWLENNGDVTQLYQIDGYIWGFIDSTGWTRSGTQFNVVSDVNDMTDVDGALYLLRNGNEGTVYAHVEASGDINVPVYDSLPENANSGDIVAVGDRKYKASLSTEEVLAYTDLAINYQKGRLKSDGVTITDDGDGKYVITDYIPFTNGTVVRIKGLATGLTSLTVTTYKSSKATHGHGAASSGASYYSATRDSSTGIITLTCISDAVAYLRVTGIPTSPGTIEDVIITANEEITTRTETSVSWTDIGEYVPPVEEGWRPTEETYNVIDTLPSTANNGDSAVLSVDGYLYSYIVGSAWMQLSKYDPPKFTIDSELSSSSMNPVQNKVVNAAIEQVKSQANTNASDIISLRNDMESLGGGASSDVVTIPSYWASMVAAKTETVKSLQTAGGKDCVSFAWASDTHIPDNHDGRTNDLGKVMAKMLDNCEIPFAVLSGDINTRASYAEESGLVTAQASMSTHLAPLWGTDRLVMALGNHDGAYGDSSGYYKKQFPPERMWQIFFRNQALDFRRVFSDDGLYFYVDNIAQKTRFIVLNSHFAGEYAVDANGWAVNNRFSTSCYGQEQLEWFSDVALDMPEGYSAIITAHAPPNVAYTVDKSQLIGIINAYCNKTTFSAQFTSGVTGWSNSIISVDFRSAKGEIIGMFAGHVHGDSIDTTTMARPLLTILSAGAPANSAYEATAPTRTVGTDTETSFDIVTINKKTRMIYCTRVGGGSDREVSY